MNATFFNEEESAITLRVDDGLLVGEIALREYAYEQTRNKKAVDLIRSANGNLFSVGEGCFDPLACNLRGVLRRLSRKEKRMVMRYVRSGEYSLRLDDGVTPPKNKTETIALLRRAMYWKNATCFSGNASERATATWFTDEKSGTYELTDSELIELLS